MKFESAGFKPVDFMNLFVDELIDEVVTQTNLYADQYIRDNHIKPKSRVRKWHPTNRKEMKKFLGLCMLMGIVRLPSVAQYWTKTFLTHVPVFTSIMPRNRFQVRHTLHL